MVIMTAKVPKRRLLLIVLLLIAAAVVLALCLRGAGGETEKPAKTGTQGATNEARIAFLESYGWQVEPEPVKTQQVTVPADPSEVFLRYNELQISQGYDLLQYLFLGFPAGFLALLRVRSCFLLDHVSGEQFPVFYLRSQIDLVMQYQIIVVLQREYQLFRMILLHPFPPDFPVSAQILPKSDPHPIDVHQKLSLIHI